MDNQGWGQLEASIKRAQHAIIAVKTVTGQENAQNLINAQEEEAEHPDSEAEVADVVLVVAVEAMEVATEAASDHHLNLSLTSQERASKLTRELDCIIRLRARV